MESLGQFIIIFAAVLVDALLLAFFLRSLFAWLPLGEETAIESFLHSITEPIIYPVRLLFYKLNIGQDFPLDIPYLVTCILLIVVSSIIS